MFKKKSGTTGFEVEENTIKMGTQKNIEENKNMPAQIISDDECEAEAVELKHNQEKFFYDQKLTYLN